MSQQYRPDWVTKYHIVGFPRSWADDVLSTYDRDLIESLGSDLSPVQYVNVDMNNIFEDLLDKLPRQANPSETIPIIFSVIEQFSRSIPNQDKKLYTMYEKMKTSGRFELSAKFPEFYTYCRQIKHNNIETVGSTVEHKLEEFDVLYEGSVVVVNHKNRECHVRVQHIGENQVYGQIVDTTQPENLGNFISVQFNQINKPVS